MYRGCLGPGHPGTHIALCHISKSRTARTRHRCQVGRSRCRKLQVVELWLRRLPADGAAAADMRAHIDRASPLAWQQPVLLLLPPYHTLCDRQLSPPRYLKGLFTSALNCSLCSTRTNTFPSSMRIISLRETPKC